MGRGSAVTMCRAELVQEFGMRGGLAFAAVCLMTLQPVLVKLSQEDGKTMYSTYSATLLSEFAKALVSLVMLLSTVGISEVEINWLYMRRYAVPGAVYFVNNNLVFLIQERLDPATFQLVGQMKIVFTGLLFRFVLNRKLTKVQYLAIWQLACGTAVSQIRSSNSERASAAETSAYFGFLLCMFSCLLSALGGIYTEKLLKDKLEDSIHWQNLQLYSWGIAFNMVGTFIHAPDVLTSNRFFEGYNVYTFCGILNNTVMGLTIAAILKYFDNIARVFAHAIAMLVTMLLSVMLFGTEPTMQLVLGIAVVTASALQYHLRAGQTDGNESSEASALEGTRLALLEEANAEDGPACKPLVRAKDGSRRSVGSSVELGEAAPQQAPPPKDGADVGAL
mmetsp:Transcript_107131/g.303568  ORF Transcript_107131/g.303568 Transcript_107131/m.303568 type:complete len:392 (-) Transcript_107131:75-1250(-)